MATTVPQRSRAVPVIAGITTLVLLGYATRYGPHRDELYFVSAGHHLQWGYPDQPPLTPLVARLADQLAPGSLLALRLIPALIAGAVVLLNAGLARELGGDRRAQWLTALTVALGSGLLAGGHLLSTTTLDIFFWTVLIRLVVGVLHRDDPRGWLPAGLVAGIGLENKSLVGPLAAALVLGIAVTPAVRHHLRSPWLWGGGALALLLVLPNLWWQAAHGWPQATLAADIRDEYGGAGGLAQLFVGQLVMVSLLGAVLIGVGLVALWRRPEWSFARPVAVAYPILMVFFAVTGGKEYYLIGILSPLVAAGAVVVSRRWTLAKLVPFTVALVVLAALPIPAMLPVLSAKDYNDSAFSDINDTNLDTIGWPAVVDQVRAAVAALPAEQRRTAVVLTINYGEAGALEWYGNVPPVYSGHNGFGDWGPPPATAGPVIYVGDDVPSALTGCERKATLDTGVDNEENGHGIWVCAGPRGSWAAVWDQLLHLDA
jgi:4-amino-4-deoxy-L-arabinose transferase-like glycosyltransferase